MPSPFQFNLVAAAHASMLEHGFAPDFSSEAAKQLAGIVADPPALPDAGKSSPVRDLRGLSAAVTPNVERSAVDSAPATRAKPSSALR